MVGYDLDMRRPVEVMVEEYPKEAEGVDHGDVLGACGWVSIPDALGVPPHVCTFLFREGH